MVVLVISCVILHHIFFFDQCYLRYSQMILYGIELSLNLLHLQFFLSQLILKPLDERHLLEEGISALQLYIFFGE
jgi:hypothetical protein